MEKVKIAVLDSGMAREISDSRIVYGRQLFWDHIEETVKIDSEITDYNGHGTACVETILDICPQAEIYVVKILGISGMTSKRILVEALKHALSLKVNIIVLAASVLDENEPNDIKEICSQIKESDVIMLVAAQNGKEKTFISNDKNIIGVTGIHDLAIPFLFCMDEGARMICNSSPIFTRGRKGMWQVFQGNSKATAVATGHVANQLMMKGLQINGLYADLGKVAEKLRIQTDGTIKEGKPFSSECEAYYANNDIGYQKFIYLLCECTNCPDVKTIRQSDLIKYQNGAWMRNLDSFLELVKERLQVEVGVFDAVDLTWAYQFYEKHILKNTQGEE